MLTDMFSYIFKQAKKRKRISEQSRLSVRVFLKILAHLAHLVCSFSLIFDRMNKLKKARKQESKKARQWAKLVVWLNYFNILAHLAHLAQFYFSVIFSAINTYNCFWFEVTDKRNFNDWRQKYGEKWPMLTTFFLTATDAITGKKKCVS